MKFLQNLDEDIKRNLLAQLRNLWTHTSTAIEGNTLTLGETAFVLEEGLTVSGKPLKDHEDVTGHARAIEILYHLIGAAGAISKEDIFGLHKAVLKENIHDIFKPVGDWKREQNGSYAVNDAGKQVFIEYATPQDTPTLMQNWLAMVNQYLVTPLSQEESLAAYTRLHVAFVRIHPFFDGNGRLARLLANLPVIKSGWPPITIAKERRKDYISLLARYELMVGKPVPDTSLVPENKVVHEFEAFCRENWQVTWDLVDEARKVMAART